MSTPQSRLLSSRGWGPYLQLVTSRPQGFDFPGAISAAEKMDRRQGFTVFVTSQHENDFQMSFNVDQAAQTEIRKDTLGLEQ